MIVLYSVRPYPASSTSRIGLRTGGVEGDIERGDRRRKQHCRHEVTATGRERDFADEQQPVECQQHTAAKEHFEQVQSGGFHHLRFLSMSRMASVSSSEMALCSEKNETSRLTEPPKKLFSTVSI